MNKPDINLKDYGIDVGLLVSGLFGARLLTSKGSAMNLARTVSSLIGGAASANYITPVVMNMTNLHDSHYQYGIAFLLGFLGLRGVEHMGKKILPDHAHHDEQRHVPVKPKKRRRVPRNY